MKVTLDMLEATDRPALIDIWVETFESSPPPNSSQDMMRLIVGWEIQAQSSRADVRKLNKAVTKLLGSPELEGRQGNDTDIQNVRPKINLSPGTRLSRDWQGRTYIVDVLDKGYAYDGMLFTSLTPIAKAITGSHRSGPLFFGVSK